MNYEKTIAEQCADLIWNKHLKLKAIADQRRAESTCMATVETNPNCDHKWKLYVGFNVSYMYCVKCDSKRNAED